MFTFRDWTASAREGTDRMSPLLKPLSGPLVGGSALVGTCITRNLPVYSPSCSELPSSDELHESSLFAAKSNPGCLRESISLLSYTSEGMPGREKSSVQGLSGGSCFPGRGGVLSSSGVSRAFVGTDGHGRRTRPWSRRGSSVGNGGGRRDKSISGGSFLIVILSVFLRLLDFETRGLGQTTSRGGVKCSHSSS